MTRGALKREREEAVDDLISELRTEIARKDFYLSTHLIAKEHYEAEIRALRARLVETERKLAVSERKLIKTSHTLSDREGDIAYKEGCITTLHDTIKNIVKVVEYYQDIVTEAGLKVKDPIYWS